MACHQLADKLQPAAVAWASIWKAAKSGFSSRRYQAQRHQPAEVFSPGSFVRTLIFPNPGRTYATSVRNGRTGFGRYARPRKERRSRSRPTWLLSLASEGRSMQHSFKPSERRTENPLGSVIIAN